MTKHTFAVFTGPQAQGNLASVELVDNLPELSEHLGKVESQPSHSNSTSVYIRALGKETFSIRWFSETAAIQRCGHGTLAAAAFVDNYLQQEFQQGERNYKRHCKRNYTFRSDLENLIVSAASESRYSLSLPISPLTFCQLKPASNGQEALISLIQARRVATSGASDGYIIFELEDETAIRQFQLKPDIVAAINKRALIITAKSQKAEKDIVFRYFAPYYGQQEDTATGSAASILWPFWQQEFGQKKPSFNCLQLSAKGGIFELSQKDKNEVSVCGSVKESLIKVFPGSEH